MLMPKRTKYRKVMRGRMTGKAYRGSTISFVVFALQAQEPAWVSSRQIEDARRAITNYLKANPPASAPRPTSSAR